MRSMLTTLKEVDVGGGAGFYLRFGPDGSLHFANVGFLQEIHAEAALTYTPSYGIRQFLGKKSLVEGIFLTILTTTLLQLLAQRLRAYTDTHR